MSSTADIASAALGRPRKRPRRKSRNAYGQEKQHFLLTSAAVDVGEWDIARLSEDEAHGIWETIKFAENDGKPFCPYCGGTNAYDINSKKRAEGSSLTHLYKCATCRKQFSSTSNTPFARRKMSFQKILYAHMVVANGVSGEAALRLRRALKCSYKAAFVLEGKIRESMGLSRFRRLLGGNVPVEVDGTEIGGHLRKANERDGKKTPRAFDPSEKKVILTIRERCEEGESRVFVIDNEKEYREKNGKWDHIRDNVHFQTHMISDEGFDLSYIGPHSTVKHKKGYKIKGVHNNGAESFFSRVKRMENGVYYHLIGPYLQHYAEESSWREDYRRLSTGEQWRKLLRATSHSPVSRQWKGYWQRRWSDDPENRVLRSRVQPKARSVAI